MGGSQSTMNCAVSEIPLNADPDVVGPGVLAAFLISATITIVAVLLAYLSDSLDQALLSDIDKAVINRANTIWRKLRGPQNSPDQDREATEDRDRIQEVFTRFVLALSDQQLVTGLAILIAGVSSQHRLSNYEFGVTLGLAWFSTTTHLATLSALREYFRTRKPLCHVRVSGMVVVLMLLIYIFFLTNLDSFDWTLPVQCVFSSSDYAPPPLAWHHPIWVLSFVTFLLALFLILKGYLDRIGALYSNHSLWLYLRLRWTQRTARSKGSMITWNPHISMLPNDELLEEYKAYVRMRTLQDVSNASTSSQSMRRRLQITNYKDSFFLSIPSIAFSYSYGISQAATYRWEDPPTLSDDSSYMGFGQIMPILLLVLPMFAALEAYYDYREKGKSHKHEHSDAKQHDSNSSPPPEDEFTNRAVIMTEYFATDIRLIKELESLTNPSQPLSEIQERHILDLKTRVLLEYDKIMAIVKEQDLIFDLFNFAANVALCLIMGVSLNVSPSSTFLPSLIGTVTFFAWISQSILIQLPQDRGKRLEEFLLGEWIIAKPFAATPTVSTNTSPHQQDSSTGTSEPVIVAEGVNMNLLESQERPTILPLFKIPSSNLHLAFL